MLLPPRMFSSRDQPGSLRQLSVVKTRRSDSKDMKLFYVSSFMATEVSRELIKKMKYYLVINYVLFCFQAAKLLSKSKLAGINRTQLQCRHLHMLQCDSLLLLQKKLDHNRPSHLSFRPLDFRQIQH